MKRKQQTCETPWHYEVIGEHIRDRDLLLVRADDGMVYALDTTNCEIVPTTFGEQWITVPVKLPGDIRPLNLGQP